MVRFVLRFELVVTAFVVLRLPLVFAFARSFVQRRCCHFAQNCAERSTDCRAHPSARQYARTFRWLQSH